MKSIQIDDDIFSALETRVLGFNETPNDVIKRLLAKPGSPTEKRPIKQNPFAALIDSPDYLRGNAHDRYFHIIAFLGKAHGEPGVKLLENYKSGSRINFARSPEPIEQSGQSTNPRAVPGTPLWAVTNLSNARKRTIISDILRMLKYSPEIIASVVQTIPDSGIQKPRRVDLTEYVS